MFLLLLACNTHSPDTGGDTGWTEASAVLSEGGSFYLMVSPDPYPILFNEPFQLIAMVHEGADHNVMFTDAGLELVVTMPAHGHGMNTVPAITMDATGLFTVEGMLFHMRGWWQLDFTATRDGVTESATLYVDCCEE